MYSFKKMLWDLLLSKKKIQSNHVLSTENISLLASKFSGFSALQN